MGDGKESSKWRKRIRALEEEKVRSVGGGRKPRTTEGCKGKRKERRLAGERTRKRR